MRKGKQKGLRSQRDRFCPGLGGGPTCTERWAGDTHSDHTAMLGSGSPLSVALSAGWGHCRLEGPDPSWAPPVCPMLPTRSPQNLCKGLVCLQVTVPNTKDGCL